MTPRFSGWSVNSGWSIKESLGFLGLSLLLLAATSFFVYLLVGVISG